MRLLLDTHAFLWFVLGDARLSDAARSHIEDANNVKYLSVASVWEMAIKSSTGKMIFHRPLADLIAELLERNGFDLLPIGLDHVLAVEAMPFHHKDPFDRLIVSQSLGEGLRLVSIDATVDSYGVDRLW